MEPGVENLTDIASAPGTVLGIVIVAIVMLIAMLSAVTAIISFMFTMTLFRVPEENRRIGLGGVWLIMIPFFGVYWMWQVTQRLAASFQSYFDGQDPDEAEIPKGDFGRKAGLWACAAAAIAHLAALTVLTENLWALGFTLAPCVLAAMILTGMYFWQIYRIRKLIPDPESAIPEDYL